MDDTDLYWFDFTGVEKIRIGATHLVTLAGDQGSPFALALGP